MKKFAFSLQRLLDYKEQVLESERAVLGEMNALLAGLEQQRQQKKQELQDRVQQFNTQAKAGTHALEIMMHKNYLKEVDRMIQQIGTQIQMQRLAVEKQTDKVREAKIEISVMEKLREKRLEEYNYKANKAQELFIEEFVSNKKATENVQ